MQQQQQLSDNAFVLPLLKLKLTVFCIISLAFTGEINLVVRRVETSGSSTYSQELLRSRIISRMFVINLLRHFRAEACLFPNTKRTDVYKAKLGG
jgi:hypothetical protein